MEKPCVSVIIPTYNRAACITGAIDSVLAQTCRDFELIIVDDGSTDATTELLQRYKGEAVLLRTGHLGPGAARNRGIIASRGEWIAFLDSDDLWLPEKLDTQLRFFKSRTDCRVCQTEELWIRNGTRVNPMKKHKKHSGWIFKQCLPLCIVSPSAVMIHRSVFDRVGLFDESLPACEDYDLWLRIAPYYEIHLIEKPMIIKRGGHPDQQSRTIPRLDRLRIQALCKVLDSEILNPEQHAAALAELEKKCLVYGNGCLKRGRHEEGNRYVNLARRYTVPRTVIMHP